MKKTDLQNNLDNIHRLLKRHDLESTVAARVKGNQTPVIENLLHRQHNADLQHQLNALHYADIADLLEAVPLDERQILWPLVHPETAGSVLLEVSPGTRESLLEQTDDSQLIALSTQLDSDELADITPYLDEQTVQAIIAALDENARKEYEKARNYPENQVGAIMDFELLKVRDDVSCKVVLRYLRRFDELPAQVDKIFVVDDYNTLLGALPIRKLLVSKPREMVREIFNPDTRTFGPHDDIEAVANAFERYDLITAPVVDEHHRLIGRLTIEQMVDVIQQVNHSDMLGMAGIRAVDELFSPVMDSFKSRWLWLCINLATAFFASRVIGIFSGTIESIVALAALMPIVAGIGGNSGNQTITIIVRAMSQHTFSWQQVWHLLVKELAVALLNGLLWGTLLGIITWAMYHSPALGGVMLLAVTLNLLLAALMGVMIPVFMQKSGRDPAVGSSVLITACTDSGGFFIFLGLASWILL